MSPQHGIQRRTFLAQAAGASLAVTAPQAADAAASAAPDGPATDLDALEQIVQGVLGRKRLGQAVFVRYTVNATLIKEDRLPFLARMTDSARRWLGQPLEQLYAVGSLDGVVGLTLRCRQGATALVSLGPGRGIGDGVDLLILGNHGAIYHDAGQGSLWTGVARYRAGNADARLTALIEKTLRSGQPEPVAAEGQP
jgi:hypothetical protein